MYITKYYFLSILHFYIKPFSIFLESIFGMSISISIKIDAQSASSIFKPKERNMFVNFTHITRQIIIWIIIMVYQMFNIILYFNYMFYIYNNNILILGNHYIVLSKAYFYTYHTSFFSLSKSYFFSKISLIKYTSLTQQTVMSQV